MLETRTISTIKDDIKNNRFNIAKFREFYKAELRVETSNDLFNTKKIILEKNNFINFDTVNRIIAQKITEVTIEILNEFFAKGKGYFNNSYFNDKDLIEIINSNFFSINYGLPILQTLTLKFLTQQDMEVYKNTQINFLTGQYFSALILKRLGFSISVPNNDIDVFILDFQNKSKLNYEDREFTTSSKSYKSGFENKNIWIKESEKIKFSHNSIPINFTIIIPEIINDFNYKDLNMRYYLSFFNLLNNFDINIVKIGLMYDLNNKFTLIIHPDFIELLKNKQFDYKIENMHLYQELRIAQKMKQLNYKMIPDYMPNINFEDIFTNTPFYFDKIKYLKSFLAQEQAFNLLINERSKTNENNTIVKKSNIQQLNFLQSYNSKYFDDINKFNWVNLELYDSKILYPTVDKKLINEYKINNTKFFEIINFINSNLDEENKFKITFNFDYLQLKKLILGCEYLSQKKIKNILEFFIKNEKKIKNQIELNSKFDNYGEFLISYILMQIILMPDLLKLEIDKINFHLLNYINHIEYRHFYQVFILNTNFIKLVKNCYDYLIQKLFKTLSEDEFEVIENSIFIKIIEYLNKEILKNIYKFDFDIVLEKVFKEILKEIEEQNKPLINYEKIEFTYYDIKVKELYTPLELQATGSNMHHCVGSYINHVKNERSVIFQIEHKYETDLKYTCEINPKTLQVVQIQGFANTPIKKEHKEFINEIIKIIKQKLAERYNINLEEIKKIEDQNNLAPAAQRANLDYMNEWIATDEF